MKPLPLLILFCHILASPLAFADAPPKPRDFHQITIAPAKPPVPALQYQLIPQEINLTPGNAAPLYLLAVSNLPAQQNADKDRKSDSDLLSEYLDMPADKLPLPAAQELINKYTGSLHFVELAARREYCHWDLPVRTEGIYLLLPHLSPLRLIARVLGVQTRVQIAQRHYDQAIHTLQTGFALAKHLNNEAVLVQALVGGSIADTMLQRLEELIQSPGAPNLYWALASLPSPFIDPRQATLGERTMIEYTVPVLKEARTRVLSNEEWRTSIEKLLSIVNNNAFSGDNNPNGRVMMTAMALKHYAAGKKYLISTGVPAEQVEQMPVNHVVWVYLLSEYEEAADTLWKGFFLPYPLGSRVMAAAEKDFSRMMARSRLNPLLSLLPAINRARWMMVRIDRQIAVLQTTEALRAYAASHDGAFPASLDDLSDMPPIPDPATGRAFEYEVNGHKAVLSSPSPQKIYELRYELTLPQ